MPGTIVKTKSGKIGRTTNGESAVMVKISEHAGPHIPPEEQTSTYVSMIPVRCDDGERLLCNPSSLIFIGFWD